VDEAVRWLSYTYLFVRMRKNPLVYGMTFDELRDDPELLAKRRELIVHAARKLDEARMVRFQEETGYLNITDLGRVASHFYIKYESVGTFNEYFRAQMTEAEIIAMIAKSQEFDNIKVCWEMACCVGRGVMPVVPRFLSLHYVRPAEAKIRSSNC